TEFRIYIFIGYNPDLKGAVQAFGGYRLADVMFITVIIGVDGHGGVAELGLRAGSSQRERPVFEVVKRAGLLFILDLYVSEAGAVKGTVIDQTLASVNKFVIPEPPEGTVGGFDNLFVQSERKAAPVAAAAQR